MLSIKENNKNVDEFNMFYEAEKEFADTIATKQIVIEDGEHLNSESGYTEFNELLKFV